MAQIGDIVWSGECLIVDYQKDSQGNVTLRIFLEEEDVVGQLRQQGDSTHMVMSHECFQSRTKYIDNSNGEKNIIYMNLTSGTLTIQGTFMQLEVGIERTPGENPGFFVNYKLIAMEE